MGLSASAQGLLRSLWLQHSPDGGYSDIVVLGQCRHGLAIGVPFGNFPALTGIQGRRSAKLFALSLGTPDSFLTSLADQFALELRHGAHDGEDQFAMR